MTYSGHHTKNSARRNRLLQIPQFSSLPGPRPKEAEKSRTRQMDLQNFEGELPVKPSVINKFQYFLIGLAVNEVDKSSFTSSENYEEAVKQVYLQWCDGVFAHFPQIPFPVGLTSTILKTYTKNKKGEIVDSESLLSGKSLVRRFSEELQPFIIEKCNPLWREPASHETIDDVFSEILQKLWMQKEEVPQDSRKRRSSGPRLYDPKWTPKEWIAFVYTSLPARERCLPVFSITDRYVRHKGSLRPSRISESGSVHHRLLGEDAEGTDSMSGVPGTPGGSLSRPPKKLRVSSEGGASSAALSSKPSKKSTQQEAHQILVFNTELARLEKLRALYEEIGAMEKINEVRALLIAHLEHPVSSAISTAATTDPSASTVDTASADVPLAVAPADEAE